MTREHVLGLVQTLGLIDLGEALTYLDEEGQVDARSSRQSVCAGQRCYSAHSRLPQQELGAVKRCSVLMRSIGSIFHDDHVHRLIDAYAHLFASALIDELTRSLEKTHPGNFMYRLLRISVLK